MSGFDRHARRVAAERIDLVSFGSQFLTARYVGWLNDDEVVRYSEQRHRHHDPASCRSWVESFEASEDLLWAIVERSDGRHVGNLTAYLDLPNELAELSILIGEKDVHGRGYGYEAWMAVCDHLFEERGIRKVWAGTMATNGPMLRLMEKAGMQRDGVLTRHYLWEGQEVDGIRAALFREEWRERRGQR